MVSLGVPMLKAGDEFCHSQNGNNNPYCQDNELSWLNWSELDNNKDFFRFVKLMIKFRKDTPALRRKHYYETIAHVKVPEYCDISWYSKTGKTPDWGPNSHDFAIMIKGWIDTEARSNYYNDDIFIIFNSHWENHKYKLPKVYKRQWHVFSDTSKQSPFDIAEDTSVLDNQNHYMAKKRSIVILLGKYIGKKRENLSVI